VRVAPGLNDAEMRAALEDLARAVGSEWVFTSDEDLDLYRDAYSPLMGQPDERVASAAVAPDTVEQVQQIVRIANRRRLPLYAISTGKNLGYGGSAPVFSGSVIVDLKRMNRVLEVDERNACALVEPGVSYFDLYDYIRKRKLKVWIDVPDPGWGSLIGNALDRGAGYTMTNYRNHFDSHCGLEVVLANGEVLRTGMGAMPGAKTWQQYKPGFGPWVDGIFSQSNFGIVTKMGFWLMAEPEAYMRGVVQVPRYQDLAALVDTLTLVENQRVCTGMMDLFSPLLSVPGSAEYPSWLENGPPKVEPERAALLSAADIGYSPALEQYALRNAIPYWASNMTFYGSPRVVQAQWETAQEIFKRVIPGVRFSAGELIRLPLTEQQKERAHLPEFGIPSLSIFSIGARSRLNPEPTHGHMWFSPIIPRSGAAILEANRAFTTAARELNLPLAGYFNLPYFFWERSLIYIVGFAVVDDPVVNRKNMESFKKLIRIAADHGWGEYRTAPVYQDAVMDTYSFNDHVLRRFHETLKDAVDPNGILSAGRYGIWPRHLRGAKH
jgi:(+)-pinoresinol hydroxylase